MGLFNKKSDTDDIRTENMSSYYSTISKDYTNYGDRFKKIAFNRIKNVLFKLGFIDNLVDEESIYDFECEVFSIADKIELGNISQEELNDASIGTLLFILVANIIIAENGVSTSKPSNRDRAERLIECDNICCDDEIEHMKLFALIKEKYDLITELDNVQDDESATLMELCKLAEKLSTVKYEDFNFKLI